MSSFQVFINESPASFFFGGVKRVDLGNLGNEGVLEFDGVIKRPMRGKNVVSLLREDICEVSTEIEDRDFFRLVSLGKLCQDCDLVDLFS